MIDLHIHTSKSDGQLSPRDTVLLAKEKGITLLSVTDHDVLGGLAEAREACAENGIEFIPGIEISVEGNRELHILGYHIDETNPALIALCEDFIRLRIEREDRIFAFLRDHGVLLSKEEVWKQSGGKLPGRPHFARAMVEAGHAQNIQDAFDRYLGTPEFDAVERTKPSASKGIETILQAGGIPVLAHPALLKLDDEQLEALLIRLIDCGLAGIECYYSTHTREQTETYLALAHKYGLLVTCGSDFHGAQAKPGIEMGDGMRFVSDEGEMLRRLKASVENR